VEACEVAWHPIFVFAAIAAGRNGEDPKASLKMESKPSFLERCGLHSRHEHS
jgi:hypothetical protein